MSSNEHPLHPSHAASQSPGGQPALVESLEQLRFEVIPMKGVVQQLEHLPPNAVVAVTVSPSKSIQATLDLAAEVAACGHRVVPHLSARLVTGMGHLESILLQLAELNVREVFVVAGDATQPAGTFEGAADLLEGMADIGHDLERVGITGYPEGHTFINDVALAEAMARKISHATHVVSQICYDHEVIRGWVEAMRARNVHLPIFVGLPGVMDRARLLRLSVRVGLGDSIRFLSKQSEVATRVLSGYQPDELIHGLSDMVGDPEHNVRGWHLFTFNEIERTERWRRKLLDAIR